MFTMYHIMIHFYDFDKNKLSLNYMKSFKRNSNFIEVYRQPISPQKIKHAIDSV